MCLGGSYIFRLPATRECYRELVRWVRSVVAAKNGFARRTKTRHTGEKVADSIEYVISFGAVRKTLLKLGSHCGKYHDDTDRNKQSRINLAPRFVHSEPVPSFTEVVQR